MHYGKWIAIVVVAIFAVGCCVIAGFGILGTYHKSDLCMNNGCTREYLWINGANRSYAHVQMKLVNLETDFKFDGNYYDPRQCLEIPSTFSCHYYEDIVRCGRKCGYTVPSLEPKARLELGWIAFLLVPGAAITAMILVVTCCCNCCNKRDSNCYCCKKANARSGAWVLLVGSSVIMAALFAIGVVGIMGVFNTSKEICLLTCKSEQVPIKSGIINATRRDIAFTYFLYKMYPKTLTEHAYDYNNEACPRTLPCYRYGDDLEFEPIRVYAYFAMVVPIGLMIIPLSIGCCLWCVKEDK